MTLRRLFLYFFLLFGLSIESLAQCPTGTAPSFPSSCTSQYFTSIGASGVGVVSTISYSASGCIGTFFDNFATQGVTAPTGSTVNINVSRVTGFLAYLAVYVDWNNNGIYQPTELVGSVITLPSPTGSSVYSFVIPLIGITTNTNLHMRVFLGEPPSSGGPLSSINPPCSAKWGEAVDYYINATCATPVIAISPASPTVCGPTGSIALTASGAGPTPTYTWTPTATLAPATGSVVTATPGTTTTYNVTGYGPGVCAATAPVTVTVNPLVTPVITPGGPTSFCPGGSVTLSETSGSGATWQWYNGTTIIPGATNSSYVATPAATTTYSVSVTSSAGCVGSATSTITILAGPVATITPAGATTVCAPATVTLNGNIIPGATYRWFDGSGLITGATFSSHTVSTSGTYSIEITTASGCKDTSAGQSVTINPAPTASATASGGLTFCFGGSVTFTAASAPGYTYQWYDGATPIAGATNITYTATITGTHDIRIKVTNGFGCTDISAPATFSLVINPLPISAITASGPLSFCIGSNVTLSVPSGVGYIYQWYFGATTASMTPIGTGGTSASYTATTAGYYYVKVTTPAGCTTNSSASPALVTVVTLPNITHVGPLRICSGSHIDLSLAGIGAGTTGIIFQWLRNGVNIPGATSNYYSVNQTGSYTCLVNVTGSCIGATPSVNVLVNPRPDPIVTYLGGYLKTGTFYSSYQWYKNFIPISGANSYRMIPMVPAEYSVIVSDTNGCLSEATNYPLGAISLGIEEQASNNAPVIYPNPSTGKVFVQYPTLLDIKVSSIDGKLMIEQHSSSEIDIATLPTGIYMIALYDNEGRRLMMQKLLKE